MEQRHRATTFHACIALALQFGADVVGIVSRYLTLATKAQCARHFDIALGAQSLGGLIKLLRTFNLDYRVITLALFQACFFIYHRE